MSLVSSSSEGLLSREYWSQSSSQCSIANQTVMLRVMDELELEGNRKFIEFSKFTARCLEQAEVSKPFIFPPGMSLDESQEKVPERTENEGGNEMPALPPKPQLF